MFLLNVRFYPFYFLLLCVSIICRWSLCNMSGWHRSLKFINILRILVNMSLFLMPSQMTHLGTSDWTGRPFPVLYENFCNHILTVLPVLPHLLRQRLFNNIHTIHLVVIKITLELNMSQLSSEQIEGNFLSQW